MKAKLTTDWIDTALSAGPNRELIVALKQKGDKFRYVGRLEYTDCGQFIEISGQTIEQAIERLNSEIMEDAAKEMVEAGVV